MLGEAVYRSTLVFQNTSINVVSDAGVKRSRAAGHNVDPVLVLFSQRQIPRSLRSLVRTNELLCRIDQCRVLKCLCKQQSYSIELRVSYSSPPSIGKQKVYEAVRLYISHEKGFKASISQNKGVMSCGWPDCRCGLAEKPLFMRIISIRIYNVILK